MSSLRYLLDTNICIYIAKKQPLSVLQKFEYLKNGESALSVITYGELEFGAQKSQHTFKALKILKDLTQFIEPLPLSIKAGEEYEKIRKTLEAKGQPISNNDIWIAAHALSLNLTLVSNNLKEFSRIPELKVENWVH
jgi:tRNA(fMet)-specific endonuclease VapC